MVIITGASSGIGKACAEHFLEKGEKVIGISRTNTLKHDLFTYIACDFNKLEDLRSLEPKLSKLITQENKVTVINNAGIIGAIKRISDLQLQDFASLNQVNITALQHITAIALRAGGKKIKAILNISSGAGRRPIASWSAYCGSKAAVDLFSETLKAEIEELGGATLVYSVAPGVVDTHMQEVIRSSDAKDFSKKENFVNMKTNNELRSPKEVAIMLGELLNNPNQSEVIVRL